MRWNEIRCQLLEGNLDGIKRVPIADARTTATAHDYLTSYVDDLAAVIDMNAIHDSGLRLGVDPLGGASVAYWPAIGARYGLDLNELHSIRVTEGWHFRYCGPAALGGARAATSEGEVY